MSVGKLRGELQGFACKPRGYLRDAMRFAFSADVALDAVPPHCQYQHERAFMESDQSRHRQVPKFVRRELHCAASQPHVPRRFGKRAQRQIIEAELAQSLAG